MWVTAGISTRDGSRRQNVSQRRSKTVPLEPAGSDPPVKCTSIYFCDFDLSPLTYLLSSHELWQTPNPLFEQNSSGTRDRVLPLFQNCRCFFILFSEVAPSSPWWNDMNIRCEFKEFSVLFRDQWDILCFMSHTATSWLSSIHTHRICQQGPGWKLLQPSCCVAAHVFSGMAEMCVILKIWEWGGTLLPFVLWGGSDISGRDAPQASSFISLGFIALDLQYDVNLTTLTWEEVWDGEGWMILIVFCTYLQ